LLCEVCNAFQIGRASSKRSWHTTTKEKAERGFTILKTNTMQQVKDLHDRIAELEKNSHPPVDFSEYIDRIAELEYKVARLENRIETLENERR
jgi:ubiquinone biosynthesis protein UbiJ